MNPKTTTLQEARDWLVKRSIREGAPCPCCQQFVKLYKRKLNSHMAYSLIAFYRHTKNDPPSSWHHIKQLLKVAAGGGEFAKLRFWGLIEEQPGTRGDGAKHRGFYRLTDLGRSFVQGGVSVPKYIYIYAGKQVTIQDNEQTDIYAALGSKFNYTELMKGAVT